MTTTAGRVLLARHIDCPGVCDVWVERDAILAIEDEMTRLRRIEKAAKTLCRYDYDPTVKEWAALRAALDGEPI